MHHYATPSLCIPSIKPCLLEVAPFLALTQTKSRLVTLLHALKQSNGRKGIASLCIGGGEGVALAVEML